MKKECNNCIHRDMCILREISYNDSEVPNARYIMWILYEFYEIDKFNIEDKCIKFQSRERKTNSTGMESLF